ncbi:chorismate mutase family protein [Streptomyces sp. DG1A-41]|uniref:chorismate mutase family protein n=1 Tax=Streptomyces sp. DG1A-41 TaxID=3125779 RepID=UPI0030D1E997
MHHDIQKGTGMTTTSSPEVWLAGLRAELDLIDATLLDTLKTRIDVCVRIAEHKREHGVPMMQPHRIGIVQERAARYGAEHGVDGTFLRRLSGLPAAELAWENSVLGRYADELGRQGVDVGRALLTLSRLPSARGSPQPE